MKQPTDREREQNTSCLVTAVCALAVFTAVIWLGCAAAWHSTRKDTHPCTPPPYTPSASRADAE